MSRMSLVRTAIALGLTLCITAGFSLVAPSAFAFPALTVIRYRPGEAIQVIGTGCDDTTLSPWELTPVVVFSDYFRNTGVNAGHDTGAWYTAIPDPPPGSGTHVITAVCQLRSGPVPYPAATFTAAPAPPPPPPPADPPSAVIPNPSMPPPPAQTAARTAAVPTTSPHVATTEGVPGSTAGAPTPEPTASPSPRQSPTPVSGCADCAMIARGGALVPGQRLTLSYSGFRPAENVALVMRSRPIELGTFIADAAGVVTADVTLPATAPAGSHTLTFSGPLTGALVLPVRLGAASAGAAAETRVSAGTSPIAAVVDGAGVGATLVLLWAALTFFYRRRGRTRGEAQPPDQGQGDGAAGRPASLDEAGPDGGSAAVPSAQR